ncbi:MAG: SDR family NAD(P)-dependent oxidoreductase [Proteobacteria bacterium]|nr:SDR family NAD(P)-dependent oxidoreductase [Pseudomonadota bacterium]MBU1388527.1 SDR family NAD(P)-dependent oxidoreductase [Pseudomonadota bacterium]MBU1544824.1 SDR family NAD(P)-dependent oxidoreductase [Pseudomonadota bacterium]MBU2482696.1 SDR family NAD(P)-dependent oxidoreductase [Pseudomonadota bacterium]
MLAIKDSVAVITGGTGGIGMALARFWIKNKGKVVLADIMPEALAQAKDELGKDVVTITCDVTSEEDCGRLADKALEAYGQINLVAPFAGIIMDGLMLSTDRETGKVIKKMSLEKFQKVVDINLTGVFLTVRECTERMINNNCRGLICLISSTGSLGTAGQINYSSTKAAMSVMPKVITAEFFRRGLSGQIRCAAVAPGYVGTSMVKNMNQKALDKILNEIPIGRLIEPDEVADLVGAIYQNEALAGETYFIHGGLRLGSRG